MTNNHRLTGDRTSVFGSLAPFQNQVVPEGESPTRTAQLNEEFFAVIASEMLLVHAALGDGYISQLPAAEGLVFTSAARPEAHARLREAEKSFNAWFDVQRKDDRDELERLEKAYKSEKKASGRESVYVPCPFGSDPEADKAKLEALREKMALQPNVTWREHHFHKASLLELLAKSACGAMTCIDEHGFRLASSLSSPRALLADLSLLSLCKGSADSSLIRASATGGANINSLKGDYAPAFNYFCSAQHEDVEAVAARISNCVSGRSARGKAIVIPVEVDFESSMNWPMFSTETLLLAMKAVYSKGRFKPEKKLQVTYETPELQAAWEAFLGWKVTDYITHAPSPADLATYKKMPATLRTIALFASQAAQTAAVLVSLEKSPTASVVLCWKALTLAQEFARMIFQVSSGEKKLAARRLAVAHAAAAHTTHEKLMAAEQALLKAIQSSPEGKISRSAAGKIKGVTLGLLNKLVEMDKVVELCGVETIKMGKTTRAYVLKGSMQMEPEEAAAELESAVKEFAAGDSVTIDEANTVYRELQVKALMNKRDHFVPVVPVTSMTPRQIAAIPRILQDRADDVVLRGTADNPEPANVVEDGEDGYPIVAGSINLWFRRAPDDMPFQKRWDGVGLSQWNEEPSESTAQ